MKPKSKEGKVDYWPKCSFFGIYDGHGGNQCAEFLRDYLHQFVIFNLFNEACRSLRMITFHRIRLKLSEMVLERPRNYSLNSLKSRKKK